MRNGLILHPPVFDVDIHLYGVLAEVSKIKDNKSYLRKFRRHLGSLRNREGRFNVHVRGEVFIPVKGKNSSSSFGVI